MVHFEASEDVGGGPDVEPETSPAVDPLRASVPCLGTRRGGVRAGPGGACQILLLYATSWGALGHPAGSVCVRAGVLQGVPDTSVHMV